MKYLDYKKEFPFASLSYEYSCFRPGDMFDFPEDGALGVLTERFNIYPEMHEHNGSYAWRMRFFPIEAGIPNLYSGEKHGMSELNLYNIHKSKCVSRGGIEK